MEAEINYWISYGKGDGSETMETCAELSEEEEKLYMAVIAKGYNPNTEDGLCGVLRRVREEIEEFELQNALDMEDCYAMECAGLYPVDADEINELVAKYDSHALKFFGLGEMSDEELKSWDAWELDELPLRKEFEPDFEPKSPFDSGWTLELEFAEPGSGLIEEAVSYKLRELFGAANGDYSSVIDYISELDSDSCGLNCDCDLYELTEELAGELGIEDFSFDDEDEEEEEE